MSAVIVNNNFYLNLSQCVSTEDKNQNINFFRHSANKLRFWIDRSNQRKQLAKLDNRMLMDIGYSREQVNVEAAKPFWK